MSAHLFLSRSCFLLFVLIAVLAAAGAARAQNQVIINGQPLDRQTVAALEQAYQTRLQPGRYWYDPVSGLWGWEKGPSAGQIHPGLNLGGRLRADASGDGTGVFFNGRELHPQDVYLLQQLAGTVIPGRYWVNALGVGGVEGGPPVFDLRALAAQRGGGRGWYHAGPGGYSGSDGKCSYYYDPQSGSSVMSGNCN